MRMQMDRGRWIVALLLTQDRSDKKTARVREHDMTDEIDGIIWIHDVQNQIGQEQKDSRDASLSGGKHSHRQ